MNLDSNNIIQMQNVAAAQHTKEERKEEKRRLREERNVIRRLNRNIPRAARQGYYTYTWKFFPVLAGFDAATTPEKVGKIFYDAGYKIDFNVIQSFGTEPAALLYSNICRYIQVELEISWWPESLKKRQTWDQTITQFHQNVDIIQNDILSHLIHPYNL